MMTRLTAAAVVALVGLLLVPQVCLAAGFSRQRISAGASAISFVDANHGYAAGEGIWKTIDGGRSWRPMAPPLTMDYKGVSAVTATAAWVCGDDGFIGHTSNGMTWQSQVSGTVQALIAIDFVSATNGWACGRGGTIVATTDGGASWVTQTTGVTTNLIAVDFVDSIHGWAVGDSGEIIATVNGGVTWTVQASGTASDLYDVWFSDPSSGWACGEAGVLLRTQNGGATWRKTDSRTTDDIYTIGFGSSLIGWMGGWSAARTADGGASWAAVPESGPGSLDWGAVFESSVVDARHCWLTQNREDGVYAWDTSRPTVKALKNVSVKRGKLAACWFRVNDTTAGYCGRVRVVVKSLRGRKIAAFNGPFGYYVTNARQRITFRAKLGKGKYKWVLSATDWAGNVQKKTSWKYFTVK